MSERTIIEGMLTVSEEVLPAEAGQFLHGPRPRGWAEDYPTRGSRASANLFVKLVDEGKWAPGFGMYTIRPRGGQVCGGWAFYGPPDERGEVEIGYGLAPSGRGRGLMTDAVRAAIRWGNGRPDVRCIWASTAGDNLASIAVLERAGLVKVADESGSQRYESRIHHPD